MALFSFAEIFVVGNIALMHFHMITLNFQIIVWNKLLNPVFRKYRVVKKGGIRKMPWKLFPRNNLL